MKTNNTRRDFIKKSVLGSLAIGTTGIVGCSGQKNTKKYNATPPPRKGKSVMGFRCEPIPTVRIGVVGLGRGVGAVKRMPHIERTNIDILVYTKKVFRR